MPQTCANGGPWSQSENDRSGVSGMWRVSAATAALAAVLLASPAEAEQFYQGPQKCAECHKPEHQVWEGTKHSQSFKEIHRHKDAKAIIGAAGGDANMRRNDVCTACHFTMAKASAAEQPRAVTGPSCESCHGPSSDWLNVHNDYGGPQVKRESETAEHKAGRIKKAREAGMIWPSMPFDVARNCLACHGLARPGIDPAVIAKMIDAGHPSGSEFELVRYSQGTVRHRFYPPNLTVNAEMAPADLARTFVTGHAAALAQTAAAASKVQNPKYQETQRRIESSARAALEAIKGQVPEAAAFLAQPNEENARKLVDAIAGKDLSAAVGSMLPAKTTYK